MALSTVSVGDLITATAWNAMIGQLNKSQEAQSGSGSVIILSGTNSITGTITFGSTFTSVPAMPELAISTAGNYVAEITAVGTSTASIRVARSDGTNAPSNTTVTFNWVAFGPY